MEVDAQKSLEVISEFEDRNTKLREEVTNAKNKIEELENQVKSIEFKHNNELEDLKKYFEKKILQSEINHENLYQSLTSTKLELAKCMNQNNETRVYSDSLVKQLSSLSLRETNLMDENNNLRYRIIALEKILSQK